MDGKLTTITDDSKKLSTQIDEYKDDLSHQEVCLEVHFLFISMSLSKIHLFILKRSGNIGILSF